MALNESIPKSQISPTLYQKYEEMKTEGNLQNPFLDMPGFDVHLDCPMEILHTILLGVVKYFWGQTVYSIIDRKKMDVFQTRLESVSSDGLNIPRIMATYICQYHGSLIGKHFKTLVQILPVIIQDLVHPDLLDTWLLLGRLMILCWHTEITDLEPYIEELDSVVAQFLTKAAICAPSIIITKPKFHFLTHLGLYIRRFGPALLFATERYESYNAVFHMSSIHSNRMAPSRDTARAFAQLDRVKHIMSGGYWYDISKRRYVQASKSVLYVVSSTSEYQRLLGLPKREDCKAGSTTLIALTPEEKNLRSRKAYSWNELAIGSISNFRNHYDPGILFYKGQSIITDNGDIATTNSAVIIRESEGYMLARLREILSEKDGSKTFLAVQLFTFEEERHAKLDLPRVTLTETYKQVETKDLVCTVNVQHDCTSFGCDTSGTVCIRQERQETSRSKKIVKHKDERYYILNMLSLHNYQILRQVLPSSVVPERTYYVGDEQTTIRLQLAARVRDKKAQAKEAKETTARELALGRAQKPTPLSTAAVAATLPSHDSVDSDRHMVPPLATPRNLNSMVPRSNLFLPPPSPMGVLPGPSHYPRPIPGPSHYPSPIPGPSHYPPPIPGSTGYSIPQPYGFLPNAHAYHSPAPPNAINPGSLEPNIAFYPTC